MGDNWFRTSDWGKEAQAEFERRLARASLDNRPQYLRIKAAALRKAGDAETSSALLRRVLDDYDDAFDAPMATEALGDIEATRGHIDEAEARYREVLAKWPDLDRTTACVEVSLANVLSQRGTDSADQEALQLLDSFLERDVIKWSNVMFVWHLTRLRIAERRGEEAAIVASARSALDLAASEPPSRRHGEVGVVDADDLTLQRLRRLGRASD